MSKVSVQNHDFPILYNGWLLIKLPTLNDQIFFLKKGVDFKFHSEFSNRLNFQIPKYHEVWAETFDKNEIQSLSKITKIAK